MTCPTCQESAPRPYFAGIVELCPHCSFLFISKDERNRQQKAFIDKEIYSEETVEKLMEKYPREQHGKKDLYARIAPELLGLIQKPTTETRALDLGASGGFFLHELEKVGVIANNLVANEMSPNYIELTRRYFGYDTLRGNVEELIINDTFDVITMFDVLEHIDDVPRALERIHTMLRPRGILFLKLPNGAWFRFKSFIPRLFGRVTLSKRLLYLEPGGHLNYWTPKNIGFLERHGFELVKTGFVQPTPRQFKKYFIPYYVWFILNVTLRMDLYPEFYAIFRVR